MPGAWVVCVFLFAAGVALFFSPMPGWMRTLQALAFLYLGVVFAVSAFGLTTSDQRSVLIRFGLITLSLVTIISVTTWRLAGCKVWRRLNWRLKWK